MSNPLGITTTGYVYGTPFKTKTPGLIFLGSGSFSSSLEVKLTSLVSSVYSSYVLVMENIKTAANATNQVVGVQISNVKRIHGTFWFKQKFRSKYNPIRNLCIYK